MEGGTDIMHGVLTQKSADFNVVHKRSTTEIQRPSTNGQSQATSSCLPPRSGQSQASPSSLPDDVDDVGKQGDAIPTTNGEKRPSGEIEASPTKRLNVGAKSHEGQSIELFSSNNHIQNGQDLCVLNIQNAEQEDPHQQGQKLNKVNHQNITNITINDNPEIVNGTLIIQLLDKAKEEKLIEDQATIYHLLDNNSFRGKYSGLTRFNLNKNEIILNITNGEDIVELIKINKLIDPDEETEWPIKCTTIEQKTTNFVVGVMKKIPPSITEARIMADLKRNHEINKRLGAKVLEIKRIKKKGSTSNIHDDPTYSVFIKFEGQTRPSTLYYARKEHEIYPYIRPLIQCGKCKKVGHKKENCTADPICGICGYKHKSIECRKDYKIKANRRCANCQGNHNAGYGGCTYLKTEKKVIKMQAEQNVSRYEARKHCWNNRQIEEQTRNQEITQNEINNQPEEQPLNNTEIINQQQQNDTPQEQPTCSYPINDEAGSNHNTQNIQNEINTKKTYSAIVNKEMGEDRSNPTNEKQQTKLKREPKDSKKTPKNASNAQATKITLDANDLVSVLIQIIDIKNTVESENDKKIMALNVICNTLKINTKELVTLSKQLHETNNENTENMTATKDDEMEVEYYKDESQSPPTSHKPQTGKLVNNIFENGIKMVRHAFEPKPHNG